MITLVITKEEARCLKGMLWKAQYGDSPWSLPLEVRSLSLKVEQAMADGGDGLAEWKRLSYS